MIKAALKILIAVAILNAAFRGAAATWQYYEFRDETEQILRFGGDASPSELHAEILARAMGREIPLEVQNLAVRREGSRTVAEARYTQPVEVFPRYHYPVDFEFSVEALAMRPAAADEVTR